MTYVDLLETLYGPNRQHFADFGSFRHDWYPPDHLLDVIYDRLGEPFDTRWGQGVRRMPVTLVYQCDDCVARISGVVGQDKKGVKSVGSIKVTAYRDLEQFKRVSDPPYDGYREYFAWQREQR